MNGSGVGYRGYHHKDWDDDNASRSSSVLFRNVFGDGGPIEPYHDSYDPSLDGRFVDQSFEPIDNEYFEGGYESEHGPPIVYDNESYAGTDYDHDPISSGYDLGSGMSPYRSGDPRQAHLAPPSNGYSSDPGSVGSSEDAPTYILEHLATFRVSKENELIYPADGMKRLLHMEKSTGIWTQKMMLRLDKKWVFILSHENGDVVEKFPMELIREPTAFTSEDPKELYNNIFIFIVAEDPKQKYNNPTEMHIFQCLRVGARDVVEDMKLYMSGKTISGRAVRRNHIPPPPQEPAPEPPHHRHIMNGYRDYSDSEVRGETKGPRSERSSVSHNDDLSSTSSDKLYEKDVSVLNSCFDDIERFIARLQHTANATKELERRRKTRKHTKKEVGDGLLSMRAKPPPERDFFDIFQKFKLSFNLLAKLRSHIHDPNAPELVHFLFSPLALIADSSRDSNYGPNPPAKVVSPLLTRDAIDLLTNCLTSRETELWQSLGDPWLIPREIWKYPVTPYQPVFSSGWAPELFDEASHRSNALASEVASEAKLRQNDIKRGMREDLDYYDSDRGDKYYREDRPRSLTPPSEYPQAGRSDVSQESIDQGTFERQQKHWLSDMKSRQVKIVQVTYPRTANNDKELTVVRGEFLEVLDDSRKWWKAMNFRGQMAHVPHTIVTPYSPDQDGNEMRQPPPPANNDWFRKERQGKKDKTTFADSSDEDDIPAVSRSIPAPPPPPPTDFTPPETIVERPAPRRPKTAEHMFGTTKSQSDAMNAELKSVLESFRRQRPHLDIAKTPDVYINQNSKPKDVQKWLKLKGFSDRICKQFDGVDGEKLFSLKRAQLEKYCGETEGKRLDSQITIQRSVSGYKTARSSELNQILAEQRKKMDSKTEKEEEESNSGSESEPEPIIPKPKPYASPVKKQIMSPAKKPSAAPKKTWSPPEAKKPAAVVSKFNDRDAEREVSNGFKFLNDYDTKGNGKSFNNDTDEDSDDDVDNYPNPGKNTLKEMIKKQRKKIINNS